MKALLLLTVLTAVLAQNKTSGSEQPKQKQSASNSSNDEGVCPPDSVFDKVLETCDKMNMKNNLKKENIQGRTTCKDGNIKQSTDDTGYLICIGNVWRKRSCPAEHVFSAVKVACIPQSPEDGHSGCTPGMTKPHSSDSRKFYICMDNEWRLHSCPDAKFFDKRTSVCVKTKSNVEQLSSECTEGSVRQDNECCEKFYVCENDKWVRRSCASGQYFDPKYQACIIDVFAFCRKSTPKPQPKCDNGSVKQDPNCCEKYLECVYGRWVQRPCPKGLYFDSSKQACIVDVEGVCVKKSTALKTVECTDGCVKQDSECCEKFYSCENGKWLRRSCPPAQYFDPRHKACINDIFRYCRQTTTKPPPECEDGCVKQDPNCCKKYFKCVHGEWVQRPCPNELYYDPNKQACVVDITGICAKNSTTPNPDDCAEGSLKQDTECCNKFYSCEDGKWVRRSCPSGQYFDAQHQACVNDVFSYCQKTTEKRECKHGSIKQDPNCCEKYLECVHGEWIQSSCSRGSFFDPSKEACIVDVEGLCVNISTKPSECTDGCVKQYTECCEKFYCCEDGKWILRPCPFGEYFDPQLKACVTDVFGYCRKTTPKPRPKCDDGCIKQDPNCCEKYLECVHGEWVQRPCPKGLYFDPNKQSCIVDVAGVCVPQITTRKPVECSDGSINQDTECCDKFYCCKDGKWIRRSCPSGQYFDPQQQTCVIDLFGYCRKTTPRPPLKCEHGRVKQDPNCCDKYLECVHGVWMQRLCANGLFFDPSQQTCALDIMGVCNNKPINPNSTECAEGSFKAVDGTCDKFHSCENGKWIQRSCPYDQYFDAYSNACVFDAFNYCRDRKCDIGCIKQDPNFCDKYLECVHSQWIQRPCPNGLYFDPSTKKCVFDIMGICIKQSTTPKPVECMDASVKQDVECCDKFYRCENSRWIRRTCPSGRYFDPHLQDCVTDTFGYCGKTIHKPEPKCKDGCVRQDPNCCEKYLECVHGEWVQRPCPKGLFFDANKQICVADVKGVYVPQTATARPVECTEGSIKQDTECCEKFYCCENGKWTRKSCPFGQYFNQQGQACVADVFSYCRKTTLKPQPKCEEGCLKQDPKCCEKYLECVYGEWVRRTCPKGLYFDPEKQSCLMDLTATHTQKCNEGCMKRDSNFCDKYFVCRNGKWVNLNCLNGYYFNPKTEACVVDEFDVCRKY